MNAMEYRVLDSCLRGCYWSYFRPQAALYTEMSPASGLLHVEVR